jgi:hypothetical protein
MHKMLFLVRGVAKVERQIESSRSLKFVPLITLNFEKERGSVRFTHISSDPTIDGATFEKYHDHLKMMIDVYFQGFKLEKHAWCWYDETEQEII